MKDSAEDTLLRAESLGLHENSSAERRRARLAAAGHVLTTDTADPHGDLLWMLQQLGLADDPHRIKRSSTHPSRPASRTTEGPQ